MFYILLIGFLLSACTLSVTPPTPEPTPTLPPPEANFDAWQPLAAGLERRTYYPDPDNGFSQFIALRFDPAYYTFRVHYRPGDPLSIRQWAEALPGAAAFVNANFFDENGNALGLVVTDGAVYGTAYTDRGGTFAVQNGQPRLRSNIREPYQGEPLEQAAQAFPMLVLDGAQAYTAATGDRITRRTAIGQDANGRIVLMATPLIGLTLSDLSAFLPTTDMGLVSTLNLDGGGSTMMYLNVSGEAQVLVASLDPVPAVIAIYPR